MQRLHLSPVAVLAAGLIVCSCTVLRADDQPRGKKSNADKIVGSWKLVKAPEPLPAGITLVATFGKDGKLTLKATPADKGDTPRGTYKVDGDKLTIKLEGQKEEAETIKTLDGKKLVTVDSQGKESEFEKTDKE
jgi:uncharacterized protein (TIGR03066 family)